ncbi:hypothetical protein HK405_015188, partial [Cladochytrium tenue]
MDRDSIYWLRGRAGSGTSTMMANLASALVIDSLTHLVQGKDGDSLLAAFFCTDTDASSTDCRLMTLNLMGELCRISNEFSHKLARFMKENPKCLDKEWKEIFENIRGFLKVQLDRTFIIVLDANGSYAEISDMVYEWRKHLPSSIRILLSNGTEDEDFGELKTIDIEVPPDVVTADIIHYAEKFLSCFGPDDDKFSLKEAAKKLGDLSKGNFSVVVLAAHLIKLRGEPPTMELLDALECAGPEHLLYFILREYKKFTYFGLLVKVLIALARPRNFAPTIATLTEEVGERDTALVGKVLRWLDPLVTVHSPPTGVAAAADVTVGEAAASALAAPAQTHVMLFSSLMTWSVDYLDRRVGLLK